VAAWTTLAVLDWTTQRFTEAGITSARLEAQLLLAHVLSCTRTQLYTNFDKPLAEAELASYRALIERRLAGEPVAYLLGEHEFWGLPLFVDANVLVPRPNTETVIEVARATRSDRAAPCTVLDLCTGSGKGRPGSPRKARGESGCAHASNRAIAARPAHDAARPTWDEPPVLWAVRSQTRPLRFRGRAQHVVLLEHVRRYWLRPGERPRQIAQALRYLPIDTALARGRGSATEHEGQGEGVQPRRAGWNQTG
jgi:hypothetical protein